MHASMRIGDSMVMASDGCPGEPSHFGGFALSLSAADAGRPVRPIRETVARARATGTGGA